MIFISHPSKDRATADAICAHLESAGIHCWIAPRDIEPGATWRWWRRSAGVSLATLGADETQIEASFREAIRIARDQKSVSLEKRAEASYAKYRDRKGDR
jgi:hypothetical protein